jgi:hypothetical protein
MVKLGCLGPFHGPKLGQRHIVIDKFIGIMGEILYGLGVKN